MTGTKSAAKPAKPEQNTRYAQGDCRPNRQRTTLLPASSSNGGAAAAWVLEGILEALHSDRDGDLSRRLARTEWASSAR